MAGAGTPLWVLAAATGDHTAAAADRLAPAVRAGVLAEVGPTGVRFRHALWAEAAERLADGRDRACRAGGGVGGGRRARRRGPPRRVIASHAAADGEQLVDGAVNSAIEVAAELVGADEQAGPSACCAMPATRRSECVDLARTARQGVGRPGRRPRVARRLRPGAHVLTRRPRSWPVRGSDALLRARAEIGIATVGQPVPSRPARVCADWRRRWPPSPPRSYVYGRRCSVASPSSLVASSTPPIAPAPAPTKPSTSPGGPAIRC